MQKQQSLPRLSRIEFFRSREQDLVLSLARAIANHVEEVPDARLTDQHLAILAWAAAAINVPNGGFVQFFYNHQGDAGLEELVPLLASLDLLTASELLRDAATLYRQHRDRFQVSNPWEGLFGEIEAFDKLDRAFMKIVLRCNRALEDWIRGHISLLAADESGADIDAQFSGAVEIRYANGHLKEFLEVKKGKPHGAYRNYFEDGSFREGMFYKNGKLSGDFWPNGGVKRKESKEGDKRIIEWFYPNGAIQKRYVKDKAGYAAEPIRLFHENGYLAEELSTVEGEKCGPWLKFFEDGAPELQAEYGPEGKLIVHNAWNSNREQVVKDGIGIFRDYPVHINWEFDLFFENSWQRESELREGIPHGKVTTYHSNVLWSITHFVRGLPNGESTTYWDNGRVRSITQIVKGKEKKSKEFPKFDHPIPAVILRVEADEKLYRAWQHIQVDEYPRPLNLEEVQQQLKVPAFLHEVHERNRESKLKDSYEDCNTFDDGIAYFLIVNESGEVTSATANGSGVYSGGEWETYPPLLRNLQFTPGRIRGRAVECRVLARVDHTFIENSREKSHITPFINSGSPVSSVNVPIAKRRALGTSLDQEMFHAARRTRTPVPRRSDPRTRHTPGQGSAPLVAGSEARAIQHVAARRNGRESP